VREIRVSVKKVDKEATNSNDVVQKRKISNNSKLLSTKDLSQETGLSSRKVNEWLVDNKYMYKKDEDWIATKKGSDFGAISREGQYGKFLIWPESILDMIVDGDMPFF
jgi:phage antirepressor YoqD-like protein